MIIDADVYEKNYTTDTIPTYQPYFHETRSIYTDKPLYGIDGMEYTELELTGDEGWSAYTVMENTCGFQARLLYDGWHADGAICTHFARRDILQDIELFSYGDASGRVYFKINQSRLNDTTTEAWKQWLKEQADNGTPVKLYYTKMLKPM